MVQHTCPVCGSGHEVHPILDALACGNQLTCSPRCKVRFPALVRARILADIAGIRGIMRELRDDLHLEASSQDIAKTIRGHCYILWVDVLEMTGKYLRGFGDPPPELVNYLDPKAHRILQYLDHLKALLTKPGSLD